MKKKKQFLYLCACILTLFVLNVFQVKAEDTIDYVEGRALTDEEIAFQKSLEPELSDKFIENFEFAPPAIQPYSILPDKYDSRQAGILSSVQNQGKWDTCWAVSVADVGGINAGNQGLQRGTDYSEGHLAYFFYNRVNDLLNNTAGDRNICPAGRNYLNNGGNTMLAAQALATWSGFADESVMPYQPYSELGIPDSGTAYQDKGILRNALYLSNSMDELKRVIYTHGAVSINYFHDDKYYNYDTAAYCDPLDTGVNHAVILVGWDDNYKKENFSENGEVSTDGAWIVKNSWSTQWGEGGYFYLSYENLSTTNGIVFEAQPADTYDHNYQYDGTAGASYMRVNNGSKISNIYRVKGNKNGGTESLEAIGITLFDSNIQYSIQVYKNPLDLNNPESGEKMMDMPLIGMTAEAGIREIDLEDSISLNQGDYYSVVIELNNVQGSNTRVGVEGNADYGWVSFQAQTANGQSYIYLNKAWQDLANQNLCARIKAFTSDIEQEIQSIVISNEKVVMDKGKEYQLTVAIMPETVDTSGMIWRTDNTQVAQVTNGVIRAVGGGQCTITASIGNISSTCRVNVRPESPKSLTAKSIDTDKISLNWGKVTKADGYIIYRQTLDGKEMILYKTISSALQTSFTDTALVKGETYFYRVYSYFNASGNERVMSKSDSYVYAKPVLPAVKGLNAKCAGKGRVSLTWHAVSGAEGYIIYRQVGKGVFQYRYIVNTNKFTDTTASADEYNYYRVYPYFTKDDRKIIGSSDQYVFARGITSAVENLKASNIRGGVKLTWDKSPTAEGYLIYTHKNGKYGYCGMTTKGASYTDQKALKDAYNFYWIFPYHINEAGKMVVGETGKYVYGKPI